VSARTASERWLRPVGVVIVAVVLIDGLAERPAPGLHGDRLGVLLALVAFATGLLGAREALLRHAPLWVQVPFLFALVAGSGVLMWLQPGGPGFLGFFFLAAWVAALRVPAPAGATAAGLALVLALAMVRAATAHRPVLGIVFSALGLSILYLVVVLAQRAREGQRRAERLLEELEHTRAAQVRAAALSERQHLAREMHDVLAHSLSALTLQLEGARLLAAAEPADTRRIAAALDRAHHLAQTGLRDARRASARCATRSCRDHSGWPGWPASSSATAASAASWRSPASGVSSAPRPAWPSTARPRRRSPTSASTPTPSGSSCAWATSAWARGSPSRTTPPTASRPRPPAAVATGWPGCGSGPSCWTGR
jgi:hypothetical protein